MHPLSPDRSFASAADHAACRALLANGSKTFMLASFLLPWRARDPAIALYAFCRQADDAVDVADNSGALEHLRDRLDAIYAGRPSNSPADRAFADAVAQFAIPRALPLALLEGFEWDIAGRRYRTIEDLEAYAARVAGAVGAMMALTMRVDDAPTLARACDLGVAMQLTNIARDVGEDARMGRVYLPLDWLAAEGVDPDGFLAAPAYSDAIGRVVTRLLDRAEQFYRSADYGVARLPSACRPAIRAARLLYAEIGRAVERNGLDSVSQRAYAPMSRKIVLAARAAFGSTRIDHPGAPVLGETDFMIETSDALLAARRRPAQWGLEDRLVWSASLMRRQAGRAMRREPTPDPARFRERRAPWTGENPLATNG